MKNEMESETWKKFLTYTEEVHNEEEKISSLTSSLRNWVYVNLTLSFKFKLVMRQRRSERFFILEQGMVIFSFFKLFYILIYIWSIKK